MIGNHHCLCLGSAASEDILLKILSTINHRKLFGPSASFLHRLARAPLSNKDIPWLCFHSNWVDDYNFNIKVSVTKICDANSPHHVKKCQTKSFHLIVNLNISSQFGHHHLQPLIQHYGKISRAKRRPFTWHRSVYPGGCQRECASKQKPLKAKGVEFVERKNCINFCILYMRRNHITFMIFNLWMSSFSDGASIIWPTSVPFLLHVTVNVSCWHRRNRGSSFPSKMVCFTRFEASNPRYQTLTFV